MRPCRKSAATSSSYRRRLLRQTDDEYPVLALTEAGVGLMKDAASRPDLTLARQRRPCRRAGSPNRARADAEGWKDVDRDLFDRLRGVRLKIARDRGVPPYVIFHDTTLRELARSKPTSVSELLDVRGVGRAKGGRSRRGVRSADRRVVVRKGPGSAVRGSGVRDSEIL